jgi:methionine aminotransferase
MESGLFSSARIFDERNQKHQFLVFSVNSICQVAIVYLDIVSVSEIGKLYQEKRDYFRQLLRAADSNSCREGTYFQVASYAAISNENDVDFANDLLRNMAWLQFLFLLFYADGKDLKLILLCQRQCYY